MSVTFATVCSGIEAASQAWLPLGWRPLFFSEIEPTAISVLTARHDARDARRPKGCAAAPILLGDFSAIRVRHLRRFGVPMPDVLAGGTPCQAFSVAGKRQSLADPRGNLSLAFVRLCHAIDRERQAQGAPGLVVVWENVPGCLSTRDNAFGCLLAGFVGADDPLRSPEKRGRWPDAGMVAGPRAWAAWRVLDAQYFGLAQRRRRVLLVVCFRNRADPAALLFEPAGVRGNPAPRGETQEDVAGTIAGGARKRGGFSHDDVPAIAHTLNAKGGGGRIDGESETFVTHALRGEGFDASEDGTGRGTPIVPVAFSSKDFGGDAMTDLAPTLRAGGHTSSHANAGIPPAIAINLRGRDGGAMPECDTLASLRAADGGSSRSYVQTHSVRRLTPTECERLQGFPDGYTQVLHRGKPMADGPRYKMIGNSWAVPKFAWLGRRLDAALSSEHRDAA